MDEQVKALINPNVLRVPSPENSKFELSQEIYSNYHHYQVRKKYGDTGQRHIRNHALCQFRVAHSRALALVRLLEYDEEMLGGSTYSPVMLVPNIITTVVVLEMMQRIRPVDTVAASTAAKFLATSFRFRFFS